MRRFLALSLALAMTTIASLAWADDLRTAMEHAKKKWLDAFNTANVSAFLSQYTDDAVLIPQEVMEPIKGPKAISEWWDAEIKAGVRNHTFQVVEIKQSGDIAYQLAYWTCDVVKDGKTTPFAGHTVRVFEKQGDGDWKVKVHMYRYPLPANKEAEK
jgi:ketosteroid isomerase-like protein